MQVRNQETCIKILEINLYFQNMEHFRNSIFLKRKKGEKQNQEEDGKQDLKEGLNMAAIKSNENGLV